MAVLEPVLRASVRPDVTFVLDATTDELMAAIGPHELETVVVALVERAARSLPDGGTIRVVAGRGPCSAGADTEWALVVVADTGPGLPSDVVPNLRDRHPTELASDDASGFASTLATVAEIGGHLDITSVAGHGTTVTVALPLSDGPDYVLAARDASS